MKVSVVPNENPKAIHEMGNIVKCTNSGTLIISTGQANLSDHFCGVVLTGERTGKYYNNLVKKFYTQFHGTITIEL